MQTSLCRFKLRRGKEEDRMKITPEEGEPIFSTDVGRLAVGNGNTPGGVPVNKVWTDSVSAETYAIIGDIKYENNKQYIYKGNNEWVQFGGDGLVDANAPLSVDTNNTVVLNWDNYEGNNSKINLAENDGKLIVNARTLVNEVSTIQNNITNINSNISELSANRIYISSSPVVLGYSAVYTDNSGEVPIDSIPVDDTLTSAITSLTGKVDNKSYTIDRGIKLLYDTDTFELTNKNVTIISEVSGEGGVKLIKKTETLPHLDINLDRIEETATAAAITNVNSTVDAKINAAVDPIISTLATQESYVVEFSSWLNGVDGEETAANTLGGNHWYRLWSDGWLEQGGFAIGGSQVITISFPITFNDINYNIIVTPESHGGDSNFNPGILEKTNSRVVWNTMIGPHVKYAKVYWYACGYNKK